MATKGKKAVIGKKRTLDETNPSDEVGQVIKKAKKQAPVNANNKTKKTKDTELDELNGSNHDQDWANNDSDSELSISDANMNGNADDDFQLGNLEIRVDRKTKQTVDEKLQKLQNTKKQSAKSNDNEEEAADDDGRGVIYIGHLPFGFFEQQLKGFFSQFGTVTRVRVSRNPKTGRSRHYGFVEFLEREVAAIAADTMDGYMMFGKRMVSKLMEPKDVKPNLFMGANRRLGLRPAPTRLVARRQYNMPKTAEQIDKNIAKLLKAEEKKRAKLKELGIDYDFPGFAAQANKVPKKIQFGYDSDDESSDEEPEEQVKPVKTPVKTPAKADKKTPVATPAKVEKKSPATTPAKVEKKSPGNTPAKKSPAKSQESTPAKATNGQTKTPVKETTPVKKSPATTPAKESAKTPVKTPAKAEKKTPVATPAKVEKKSPATTPAKESAKTPAKTPNKSPAKNGTEIKKTPAKTPVKTPGKSPKSSK